MSLLKDQKHLLATGAFLLLVVLGAKIDLDFGEQISFTLQTLFLGLAYYYLPKKYKLVLIVSYLLLGVLGVPVFNGGIGLNYVFSSPLGFFIGFVLSAFVPTPNQLSFQSVFLYLIVIHVVILSLGTLWLVYFLGLTDAVRIASSLSLGMVIKSVVASLLIVLLEKGGRN